MGLLIDHLRPGIGGDFFNTVCTKLYIALYFHNDFIFVRPATATDYIEARRYTGDISGLLPSRRRFEL